MDPSEELTQVLKAAKLELHPDSPVPIYYQLSRVFEMLIQDDVYRPGARFPSEEAISAHFQVSRPTANKAVQILINDGWLSRHRQDKRSGTVVVEKPFVTLSFLTDGLSFADQFPPDVPLESRIIWTKTVPATARVAKMLKLGQGDPILHMRRLRFAYGQPVMVCDSRVSKNRFPGLFDQPFVDDSLYRTLAVRYECPVVCSERRAEAVEAIDPEVVELLGIHPFSSIMKMIGVSCTHGMDPVDYLETYLQHGVSLRSKVFHGVASDEDGAGSQDQEP
jgi:GntR family transcriptional regulator